MIYVSKEVMELDGWEDIVSAYIKSGKIDPRIYIEASGEDIAVSLEFGSLSNLLAVEKEGYVGFNEEYFAD